MVFNVEKLVNGDKDEILRVKKVNMSVVSIRKN